MKIIYSFNGHIYQSRCDRIRLKLYINSFLSSDSFIYHSLDRICKHIKAYGQDIIFYLPCHVHIFHIWGFPDKLWLSGLHKNTKCISEVMLQVLAAKTQRIEMAQSRGKLRKCKDIDEI